jgi:prophage antirepressor-like protein
MIALDSSVLSFNGSRFSSVELEGEFWLRPDELGHSMGLPDPERTLVGFYDAHPHRFSERLTALAGVETPDGPRLMRVFNLLGAYVLCTFVDTPESHTLRRWLLETLVYLQIDVKRELKRMNEELRALRADVEMLKDALRRKDAGQAGPDPEDLDAEFRRVFEEHTALLRAVAEDMRGLRAARAGGSRDALDAEFRRVVEERTSLLLGLAEDVKAMRGSWAGGPARFQGLLDRATEQLQDLLDDPAARALGWELPGLAKAVAGLTARLESLTPARRDVARASRAARAVPGVPAPAVPDLQTLRFAFRDDPDAAVWGVLFAGDPTPWLSAADIGRLAGLSATRLAGGAAEVGRLVPEAHRTVLEDGLVLVDPVGVDTLLFHWGDVLDDGQAELWRWLAGEVVPALHAAMLRQVQADPEAHPGFPGNPTEVVADAPGLFKVWAGELDGHPARLVNTRDLHRHLKAGWKTFADWFRERDREFGWREGRDYRRVYVRVGQYDPYLSLDAALALLALETCPAKAEAQAYLQRVALGQPATLEGVAVRVEEGTTTALVPMTYRFEEKREVRVVMKEEESWWVAKDVAEALDYPATTIKNMSKLIGHVPEEWKGRYRIPTLGGEQELAVLSEQGLYFFLGRSDKPKALPFQKKVAEIITTLRKTGRYEMPGAPGTAAPQGTLPDTPPRAPLVFPYRDAKGHELQVRVPIQNGREACAVADVATAIGDKAHDFERWYAALPTRYHGSMPSLSGETALATLSAEGLGYLFGQRAHRPEVEAFRAFWFGTVEPALAARRAGGAPQFEARPEPAAAETSRAAADAGPAPAASEDSGAGRRARFGELAAWLWRHRDGRTSHVFLTNSAAILARLWTLPESEGLALGVKKTFARSVGLATGQSAEQGLGHLRRWGLVEAEPDAAAWPEHIRLNRTKVEAALREAGLEVPE